MGVLVFPVHVQVYREEVRVVDKMVLVQDEVRSDLGPVVD